MGQDPEWLSIAPQMLQVLGRGELAFCDIFYVAFISKASKDRRVSKKFLLLSCLPERKA